MKWRLFSSWFKKWVLVLPALGSLVGATIQTKAENIGPSLTQNAIEFFHHRHLEGVGLVLWGMDELTGSPREFGGEVSPGPLFRPLLKMSRGLDELTRGVGVLRVQDGLDVTLTEPQAATYQWVDDRQLGNYWNLDAAAILDIYLPGFGWFLSYDEKRWAFHLRAGASWERNTLSEQETDRREFFLGATFQPGVFESIGRLQATDMQFGLLYREDAVTDAHQWVVALNIQPTIPIIRKRSFVLGQKVTFKELLVGTDGVESNKNKVGVSSLETAAMPEKPRDFFFIRPNFSLEGIVDSVVQDGTLDTSDYAVTYGGRVGFSLFRQRVTASYNLIGISPIEDLGESHLFHEARLEYQPHRELALRFALAYQFGERAPDFREEDRLVLSVGVRF